MKLAFSYPLPLQTDENWKVFRPGVERYVESWRKYPPEVPVTLFAVGMGNDAPAEVRSLFYGLPVEFLRYEGKGLDCRVTQFLAPMLDNYFLVGMPTRAYFHRTGAARHLLIARERFGPGLYGTSWSREARLHIRTCFYGIDANYLSLYPVYIDSPESGTQYEIGNDKGQLSLMNWCESIGIKTALVYWSGTFHRKEDWNQPNSFRCGNQENLLVWDKQTDLYESAGPEDKTRLHNLAFGLAIEESEA